jgi:hypothetical protein
MAGHFRKQGFIAISAEEQHNMKLRTRQKRCTGRACCNYVNEVGVGHGEVGFGKDRDVRQN